MGLVIAFLLFGQVTFGVFLNFCCRTFRKHSKLHEIVLLRRSVLIIKKVELFKTYLKILSSYKILPKFS